jgi:Uma2 family endonuclease
MTTLAPTLLPHLAPVPLPARMSYEQYVSDTSIDPHTEWVDGEVIPMPGVAGDQADADIFLGTILKFYVDLKSLGVVRREPFQMKTGPDLPGRSPDILFVANRNRQRLRRTFLEGPADLVVEIIRPDSQTRDRVHKFAEYEAGGVTEYWLVDPDRRTAEFFQRRRNGKYKALAPDAKGIYHSKAVPGFWLTVDWLWRRPLPSTVDVLRAWGVV